MRRRAIAAKRADTDREERAPAVPPLLPEPAPTGQMSELDELREQGILTEEEFAAEQRKLLGI